MDSVTHKAKSWIVSFLKSSDANVTDECAFRTGFKVDVVGPSFAKLLEPPPSLAHCFPALHHYAKFHDSDQAGEVAKLWFFMSAY